MQLKSNANTIFFPLIFLAGKKEEDRVTAAEATRSNLGLY
jgi:hypothetical protein